MASGGYDVANATVYTVQGVKIGDLNSLTCSICKLILRDPKQVISCGHRFCKSCIEKLTNGSEGPYECPLDKEKFQKQEVRTDRGCMKEIDALTVDCPTRPNPCTWRGKLTEIENHKETCPNKVVVCTQGCGSYIKSSCLLEHVTTDCPKRHSVCKYCKQNFPLDALKGHYGECDEHPVDCNFCNKPLSARKQLSDHLEQECDKYLMSCPHKTCSFQEKRLKMMKHIGETHLFQLTKTVAHLEEMFQTQVKNFSDEISTLKTEVSHLNTQVDSLTESNKTLTEANKKKDKEIKNLKSIVLELEEKEFKDFSNFPNRYTIVEKDGPEPFPLNDDIEKDYVTGERQNSSLPKSRFSEPCGGRASKKELDHPVEGDYVTQGEQRNAAPLQPIAKPLGMPNEDSGYPRALPMKLDTDVSHFKKDLETQHSQLLKMNDNLQNFQQNLTQYAVAIDEIRLRQDVLDVKTTNGVLVWKIPDLRRRYRDAIDHRTVSLYSPPFYTSPHGYRMCIRTYLNGDGIGKGTHLSVFFVIMRSEHDNLLSWPFKQSVRFTLINQSNLAKSITEAFVPDLKSPSFQKPESDMNIASGFPKFARQSILQDNEFTQGNVIYIKCQVDLTGLNGQ